MARPGPQTYAKRQREQEKREKRRIKHEKKSERKDLKKAQDGDGVDGRVANDANASVGGQSQAAKTAAQLMSLVVKTTRKPT